MFGLLHTATRPGPRGPRLSGSRGNDRSHVRRPSSQDDMGRTDERLDRRHDARALAWITVKRELEAARDLAIVLARRAGTVAPKSFGQDLEIERKGERGDLVTEADLQAEHLIVVELQRSFPNHGIVAEESGRHGPESEWVWWVDPLDGTNNLVLGLPPVQRHPRGANRVGEEGRVNEELSGARVRGLWSGRSRGTMWVRPAPRLIPSVLRSRTRP